MGRRQALMTLASAGATLGLAMAGAIPRAFAAPRWIGQQADSAPSLPDPDRSGIEHIVVAMMENRSFDHLLGWLPDHDGQQAGLQYADRGGQMHPTHRLGPDFQGCGYNDPDHSFRGGRAEYNNGRCDGWLRAGKNDLFSIGYYTQQDLAFLGAVAPQFVTPARYFAAIMAPTFPNRIYQHAATTDRLSNTNDPCRLPTIWDGLANAGISGAYYASDLSVLDFWGQKYRSVKQPLASFYDAAADGSLPSVAFVDPAFMATPGAPSDDDHPLHDIRDGEAFMATLYSAVTGSPAWSKTLMIINFDEWGGFFDHISPPAGPVTTAEQALGYRDGLRGFRVPCVVISPWSQNNSVTRTVFDHTSILKLIEWRFGLDPLTERDAQANNLAEVLDFDNPRLDVPDLNIPAGPFGGNCSARAETNA
jgi:phospholipase C